MGLQRITLNCFLFIVIFMGLMSSLSCHLNADGNGGDLSGGSGYGGGDDLCFPNCGSALG